MSSFTVSTLARRYAESAVIAQPADVRGWGLFAEAAFAVGEPLFWVDVHNRAHSHVMHQREAFGECDPRSVTLLPQVAFCFTAENPLYYVNHACDANSGFINWGSLADGKLCFAAFRDIARGEQITVDYSALTPKGDGSPQGDEWQMPCLCGQAICRHLIEGFDRLTADDQKRFVLSESPPYGRVIAHILAESPQAAEALCHAAPHHFRHYQAALAEQQALAAYFKARLG